MQNFRAYISLDTVKKNARLIASRGGVPLVAVVKDDAYGHGAEAVALSLFGIASQFAVSTVREGASLRVAGVSGEIMVFTPPLSEEEALACSLYSLTPTLPSFAALGLYLRAKEKYALSPRVQFAVNTGMNRYGFRPSLLERACRTAEENGLEVVGAFSHFYLPEDEAARERQYALFLSARETVKKSYPNAKFHLSATGGILAGKKYAFDMVRSGIALYGYLPRGFEGAIPVKPAMKVYATVSQRGKFTGGGAGYARAEKAFGALHTLSAGYGGGFFRSGGFGIGKLCMDACVREGDAPFGRSVCVLRDAEAYARAHGTTAYEVLVRIGRGAEKFYV